MQFHEHTLDNGLQIIGETIPSSRSVALGFFVRTGSRDETPEVSGVSHFLEHMVFKGTPNRTALEVNRDFDRMGAQYNAFTSEENTVFYAAILPEYLPNAIDVLTDILRPSLRGDDFDMEKKVIIEEIGMYDDQPIWSAYDRAKQLFFTDHPLGNSILGTVQSIEALNRDQMDGYFKRRYVPSNITAVAAGNYDWDAFIKTLDKHCGSWERGAAPRDDIRDTRGLKKLEVVTKDSVFQEHVFALLPAPAADSLQRHAADTLAMILGDDSNSRFYWALIDTGLAESADFGFHEFEGTGSFIVSLSCDPESTKDNLSIIEKVLQETQKEGVTEEELQQAKSKIQSRVVRGSERPMGRMQAIGMSWSYLKEYRSVDDELEAFDRVNLQSIREVLDAYPLDLVTTLAYGPLSKL